MEGESKITLRLPAELHAALTERAQADERSLNGEIVYLLRQAVAPIADADAYKGKRGGLLPSPHHMITTPIGRKPRGSR